MEKDYAQCQPVADRQGNPDKGFNHHVHGEMLPLKEGPAKLLLILATFLIHTAQAWRIVALFHSNKPGQS